MTETWRTVPSAPTYEASSHGRVRNATTGHVLKLQQHDKGYLKVSLGRKRYDYVHRIVCEAFHGPAPDTGPHTADHLDFDRTNNTPSNLRWLARHLNDWRWKGYEDIEDEPYEPLTDEESAALDAQLEAAGW